MVNPARTRKRLHALRRAPDGSAFEKWESLVKTRKSGKWTDVDRKGFETWKNMSNKEKQPYIVQAEKLYAAHRRALVEELSNMPVGDDEADSAMVGKHDKFYFDYYEGSEFESLDTYEWKWFKHGLSTTLEEVNNHP